MSLTIFMITPSSLLMFAALWLTGAAMILGLFLYNHRRILLAEGELPR